MRWQQAISKAITTMLPWASKHERRAAIGAARAEKERSQRSAAKSREVRAQIDRLALKNHYAQTIENQIMRGHGRQE